MEPGEDEKGEEEEQGGGGEVRKGRKERENREGRECWGYGGSMQRRKEKCNKGLVW